MPDPIRVLRDARTVVAKKWNQGRLYVTPGSNAAKQGEPVGACCLLGAVALASGWVPPAGGEWDATGYNHLRNDAEAKAVVKLLADELRGREPDKYEADDVHAAYRFNDKRDTTQESVLELLDAVLARTA